jgi:Leucine-rich repeat (LRR) protein
MSNRNTSSEIHPQQLSEIPKKERNVLESFGFLLRHPPDTRLLNGINIENGHVRKIFHYFNPQEEYNSDDPNNKIGENVYFLSKPKNSEEFKGILENIRDLEYLEHIKFESVILNTLPKSIGELKNLKTLNFRRCNITVLPESLRNLMNLTEFNLGFNKLTSIEWIGDLKNLTHFSIERNELTSLPISIGNLKNLTHLSIGVNRLESLPESIGNLKNLTYLSIGANQLETVPASIGNLKNLRVFYLNHCHLKSVPPPIQFLTNLRELNLNVNQISSLPEWIGDLTNLSTLDLGWNQLSTLPDSFENLEKLSSLGISNNKFTELPGVLNKFNQIENITLDNPFKSIKTLRHFFHKLGWVKLYNLSEHLRAIGYMPETVRQLIWDSKNIECLFKYYETPLTEIVEKCISDFNSLSDHEIERLSWESSNIEREILELYLPNDHPILEKINGRLKFHFKNGMKLFK